MITGRTVSALDETVGAITAAGGSAFAVPADITKTSDVDALATQVAELLPKVDVLVNNSGVSGPSASLWEIEPDDWDATFAVNVRGTYLCCRAFLPRMLDQGSGSIVTIGSMTGKRPLTGRTAYSATKTALIGLTRTLAHEVGPQGIRVNLVSPGGVEGERIDRVIAMLAQQQGTSLEETRRQFTDPAALKRLVPADDVANAVLFLASDLSVSVTGVDLNVSAGVVMH